jgi:hypothetical protein
MGMDARSSRIAHQVLLIALAIQGLTPDFRNQSSAWLFRILTWESADLVGGDDSGSLPLDDFDEGPGEVFAPGGMHPSLRLHRDAVGRPTAEFGSICACERMFRSAILSFHPHILAMQGGDDLIRSLCRFHC